jgi:hypothetical protein
MPRDWPEYGRGHTEVVYGISPVSVVVCGVGGRCAARLQEEGQLDRRGRERRCGSHSPTCGSNAESGRSHLRGCGCCRRSGSRRCCRSWRRRSSNPSRRCRSGGRRAARSKGARQRGRQQGARWSGEAERNEQDGGRATALQDGRGSNSCEDRRREGTRRDTDGCKAYGGRARRQDPK